MGKLLTYRSSFEWEDSKINRGVVIQKLNQAIIKSKEYKDNLFKVSDLNSINLSWGNFMEFVFSYGFEEEQRKQIFPWMSEIQHTTLVNILINFKNTSALNSLNLNELNAEFPGENCGYIGFELDNNISRYVFCNDSLDIFHQEFVSKFDFNRRKVEYEYFERFFIPELKKDPNQINQKIKNGKAAYSFKELHLPKIPGEQIHIHFHSKSNCALNIDGSWKHEVPNFKITTRACEELSIWGFRLPLKYYRN